jgi:hypothetical protein
MFRKQPVITFFGGDHEMEMPEDPISRLQEEFFPLKAQKDTVVYSLSRQANIDNLCCFTFVRMSKNLTIS